MACTGGRDIGRPETAQLVSQGGWQVDTIVPRECQEDDIQRGRRTTFKQGDAGTLYYTTYIIYYILYTILYYTYAQILLYLFLPILVNDKIVGGVKQNTICTDRNQNICNR